MIAREFWLSRIHRAWEQAPIVWLAGVRRVGKTTLACLLPADNTLEVNCDSPCAAQEVADPE